MASTQENIVQRILDSPIGRAAVAAEAAEVDKQRAAAIAGIERARQRHIAEGLASTKVVEDAAAARLKAREVALAADRRLGEATAARLGASAAASAEIAGYESVLRETAPAVAEFTAWLNAEYDRVRQGLQSNVMGKERSYPTLQDREVVATNYPTTGERLAALRAARVEAADIGLTVASIAELKQRLEQIRAALPAVEMELTKG